MRRSGLTVKYSGSVAGTARRRHGSGGLVGLVLAAIVAGSAGCSWREDVTRTLMPVALPDVSKADRAYQTQVSDSFQTLESARGRGAAPRELAEAYGRLGMLLQAGGYNDAAEPFYINARTLDPTEVRWPYHLGHLRTSKGDAAGAEAHFRRALEIKPGDVAIQIWLGRLLVDAGRADEAEPLFDGALRVEPRSIAALAGLGQVSLSRRDYGRAVQHFEQALAIDPQADSLHSPLALAYRGLGQPEKAQPHLRQWVNRDILVSDPLQQEIDMLIESGLSYELRGVRSLDASDWVSAAGYFRRGLELTPQNTLLRRSLQHKLGTALFLSGDPRAAAEQFEAVVAASPKEGVDETAARAHYSLGVLAAAAGKDAEALTHFSGAVARQPSYAEAHLAFADTLRRSGRLDPALMHYAEVVQLRPQLSEARFGYAMALIRLHRYADARRWLEESMALHPDRPQFAHALARVLAAAPDDRVRDGERAVSLVRELFKSDRTIDMGETMAMAMAEVGDYRNAAGIQRGIIDAARRGGLQSAVSRMTGNLVRYESGRPCRMPWRDDDPIHRPPPPTGLSADTLVATDTRGAPSNLPDRP
jgi:tetratricopeptide (TPR) repeat protein